MQIFENVLETIGNTPLIRVHRIEEELGLECILLVKPEGMNPAGSAKDRAALYMLNDAENRGLLQAGGTIIEPTSGNTGVGLVMAAAVRGYRLILTMPENMSIERQRLLRAYGAEVILTPAEKGMAGAIEKANTLLREIPGSFMPGQFDNPANPLSHYETTGPEIWRDTAGMIDIFAAGIGTGGTISGTGRYLKEQKPMLRVIAAEPKDSAVLSGGKATPHKLQGMGAGFIPAALDITVYDEVIPVSTESAYAMSRLLAQKEGILCGISSGAALYAAVQAAKVEKGKVVVALLPDTGERYLSTDLFE
ncbi:MAG: cysteine synthase A [Clostridia bacterium]|nr:cysteine synthase A [Clostridia bacterium]